MNKGKPTYKSLVAALGTLLAEYAAIDGMLDQWAEASPDGETADEKRRHRASNKGRDRIQRLYERAVAPPTDIIAPAASMSRLGVPDAAAALTARD